MTLEIRQATRDDMFAILQLIKEGASPDNPTYPKLLGSPDSAKLIAAVESSIKDGLAKVALKGDAIVGAALTSMPELALSKKRALNEMFFYLKPEARHDGDGFEFMKTMPDLSKAHSMPYFITVHEHDETASQAEKLEQLGFKRVSTIYMLPLENDQ